MNKKKQLKVIYTKYGLANFFGNYVEINEKLKYNKLLRDYVVKHELGHSEKFDLKHEFKINWRIIFSLILFVFKNPATWIDFFPIQIRKKRLVIDINLIILYSLTGVLVYILIKIFKLFL